jgi:hypothetical protein
MEMRRCAAFEHGHNVGKPSLVSLRRLPASSSSTLSSASASIDGDDTLVTRFLRYRELGGHGPLISMDALQAELSELRHHDLGTMIQLRSTETS